MRLAMLVETRYPTGKLQSNLSKHIGSVTWQNSHDNIIAQ